MGSCSEGDSLSRAVKQLYRRLFPAYVCVCVCKCSCLSMLVRNSVFFGAFKVRRSSDGPHIILHTKAKRLAEVRICISQAAHG